MRDTDALLQFKRLCEVKTSLSQHVKVGEGQHHDKLAATKQRERELKDAIKADREQKKQQKEEAKHKEQAANKFERLFNGTSKRAARDLREAVKREVRRESGQTCQHGVWKCRICFPVTKAK